MTQSTLSADLEDERPSSEEVVAALIRRGRTAMDGLTGASQSRIDEAVTALAWSIYQPERASILAEEAVRSTGLGNVPDKVTKNMSPG